MSFTIIPVKSPVRSVLRSKTVHFVDPVLFRVNRAVGTFIVNPMYYTIER